MRPALRHLTAWLSLATFATALSLPVLDADHAGRVDPETLIGLQAHRADHDVPHLGGPSQIDVEHCAICHWVRSLSQSSSSSRGAVVPAPAGGLRDIHRAGALTQTAARHCPVRGPPVLA